MVAVRGTNQHVDVIEGSEGRTVAVERTSQYMGDCDTIYGAKAVIENEDGTYRTEWCGVGGGYNGYPDISECIVDGDVAKYNLYLAEEARKLSIKTANMWHFKLDKGKQVIVTRGKRKRKNEGRVGFVFWIGETRYGPSVGIEEEGTQERFFVPPYQVQVVPLAEEQIGG